MKRCQRCLLGWWDWGAFNPTGFYDRSYFQGTHVCKGYDDYAALEPGLLRTARTRLRRIAALLDQESGMVEDDGGTGTQAPSPKPRSQIPPRRIPRSPVPRRLLEVGCGTGVFLLAARQAGWQVEGIEVSAYAAQVARQRGLNVVSQGIEDTRLTSASYDCVAFWDVLEHLRDPGVVLRMAASALRPGGVLALSTGDITSLCARLTGPRWHLFNLPEHLFFFSPGALNRLLRQAGCRVVKIRREVTWVPAGYLVERLRKVRAASKSSEFQLPSTQVRTRRGGAGHRITAAARLWLLPATLFDVLGIYAQRL